MLFNVGSVSGGKDSGAVILKMLAEKVENPIFVNVDTGNEFIRIIEDYLCYLEKTLHITIRREKADFSERIAKKRMFIARDVRTGRNYKPWFEKVPFPDGEWSKDVWDEDRQDFVETFNYKKHWNGGVKKRWSNKAKRRALEHLHPTGNPFLDLCMWKGRFPSRRAQFCTEELKKVVIHEKVILPLLEAGHDVVSWQGVRRDESHARRNRKKDEHVLTHDSGAELWIHLPIVDWTAKQVFDYHRENGIDPNPLYKMDMSRIGCAPCINVNKDELLAIAQRFPEEIERIAEWEHKVAMCSKRGASTFFCTSEGKGNNIKEVVEWSKTSHGSKTQYDMLRMLGPASGCSSRYGLCE